MMILTIKACITVWLYNNSERFYHCITIEYNLDCQAASYFLCVNLCTLAKSVHRSLCIMPEEFFPGLSITQVIFFWILYIYPQNQKINGIWWIGESPYRIMPYKEINLFVSISVEKIKETRGNVSYSLFPLMKINTLS